MTLEECYQNCKENYEDVLLRFRTENRIERFVVKFLDDQSYKNLTNALEQGDIEVAFRFAHTLKGIAQNLGFSHLAESASALTEVLRGNQHKNIQSELNHVEEDYQRIISAIKQFQSA